MSITTSSSKTTQHQPKFISVSPRLEKAKQLRRRHTLIIIGGRILFLICLLTVWQFVSGRYFDPLYISSPSAILTRLLGWISDGTLWFHTEITLQETLYALFFGVVVGLLTGLLFGLQQNLAEIMDPFIMGLYSIPKVALAPLFILWFGIDMKMKIVFSAVTVFFLVFLNTLTGVRNVDKNLVDAVHVMGGKRQDVLVKVVLPSATGYMLTGLRIAIPYALMGVVIAELIASNRGIGYLIYSSESAFDTAGVFASLLVLTIIAILLNACVNFIDHRTSRWKVGINLDRKILP